MPNNTRELRIRSTSGREVVINDNSECFVIAEIGHNHQGKLETCKEMFKVAKDCGVDSVKLQKRDNKFLFTRDFYDSAYNSENAYGPTYGAHREALEFGLMEYKELQKAAKDLDLVFFSTAFDHKSADFLAELDIPCFKMASGDITNVPLLKYVAKIGKPMIISTGAATLEDVRRAYEAIIPINSQLAILQCTASYPVDCEQLDLRVIETYRREFPQAVIGLSDHFNGISMAPVAYALGARIVEKHFTLNRAWKGTDHAFSLEPVGMKKMCRDLKRTKQALGDGSKHYFENEKTPRKKMGKKIVAARDLPAGHVLKEEDLAYKSPGDGLPPYRNTELVGTTLKVALKSDQGLELTHVDARHGK